MITLSGGPCDGQTLPWTGSDYIEMAPLPPMQGVTLDFSVPTVEPFRVEKLQYRRSINNPNIFVFQP